MKKKRNSVIALAVMALLVAVAIGSCGKDSVSEPRNVPTTHVLFQVNIQDFKDFGDNEIIGHHTEAFYGISVLMAQTENEKDL